MEFVDTNVFIYAHDARASVKRQESVGLLKRLSDDDSGALSLQVLTELYSAATRKLGIPSFDAERIIEELGTWALHRPTHSDLLDAIRLVRRYKVAWWDALILQSATEMGCSILWTEDFADGQRYGSVTVRNPFRR